MVPPSFDSEHLGRTITASDLEGLVRSSARSRLPKPGKGEQYLGGPIPLDWLSHAAMLSGKAFHLGVALWYAAIRSKGKNPSVRLSNALAATFGLGDRKTRTRALIALEEAGLVAVKHSNGHAPLVTILPKPTTVR